MEVQLNSYVTLLSSDMYLTGTLMLGRSLAVNGTIYSLTAMVTDDVSGASIQALSRNNIKVIRIESLRPPQGVSVANEKVHKHYYTNTFSKLHVLNMNFDKVVYLDSDMLPMVNLDHLFEEKSMSACLDNPTTARSHLELRAKMNSGLMVIEPSEELFKKALNHLENLEADNGRPLGDQDIFQRHFEWNILDQGYNIFVSDLDCYEEAIHMYVLHYIMTPKPWWDIPDPLAIPYRKFGRFPYKTIAMYGLYKTLCKEFLGGNKND